LATCILTFIFSRSLGGLISFYFVSFLLPVVIGTSFFFNYVLVPRFLLHQKRWKFVLYFLYMLIISIYLEMLIMILAFVILADYRFENLGAIAGDIYMLTLILYLIVFVNGFIEIFIRFQEKSKTLEHLEKRRTLDQKSFIVIKEDRKNVRINLDELFFIESLSDYLKIQCKEKTHITKKKISVMQQELPEYFIRIHRSYIVNSNLLTTFNKEEVRIGGEQLPIGRKYKEDAIAFLLAEVTDDNTTHSASGKS